MLKELRNNVNEQLAILQELDEALLARTPANSTWNGAQCIQHMSLATELYLSQIEEKISRFKPASRPYVPGYWAEKFISGSAPDKKKQIRYKMKTIKRFEPGSPDPSEALHRLKVNLKRLLAIIDKAENKDLRSFKVTTALGPILRFWVGDALRFISAHNERHFLQLEKILAAVRISSVPA